MVFIALTDLAPHLSPALIATHLLAFTLGVSSCWILVRKEGEVLNARKTSGPATPRPSRRKSVGVILLVVSLILIGFGIQQYFFQKDGTRRDGCLQTWGQTVIETVNARTQAAKAVERINQRHDAALDAVILDVLGIRQVPPTSTEKDLDKALIEFSQVKIADDKALKHLNETRQKHPYPRLHCN